MYYLTMKIPSSSPYATFNPKEWNSLSTINYRCSNTPIKFKKKYFSTFTKIKSVDIGQENSELPKEVQLAFE